MPKPDYASMKGNAAKKAARNAHAPGKSVVIIKTRIGRGRAGAQTVDIVVGRRAFAKALKSARRSTRQVGVSHESLATLNGYAKRDAMTSVLARRVRGPSFAIKYVKGRVS